MGTQVKQGGAWVICTQAWVRAAGAWNLASAMYANAGGTWVDVTPRITLTINANTANYSIRDAAIAAGWDGASPVRVEVTIGAGVVVYGTDTSVAALRADGTWPAGCLVTIINNGTIVGMGGRGGNGMTNSQPQSGSPGGPAILTNAPTIIINNGTIAGGGGGGAGGAQHSVTVTPRDSDPTTTTYGGCGGSGGRSGLVNSPAGLGGGGNYNGYAGNVGTFSAPGAVQYAGQGADSSHNDGGAGGQWGSPGGSTNVAGGAAGKSIIGIANVTIQTAGSILGPTA